MLKLGYIDEVVVSFLASRQRTSFACKVEQ